MTGPPLRIAFVGPVPPLRGGIAQHGANLTAALRAAGMRVDVQSWASQYPGALYPGAQRDESLAPLEGARFDLRWWDPSSWWRAGRRARGADVLVFPWVTPVQAPAYRALIAAAGRATRVVAVVHNALPHERRLLDVPLTRWILRRVRGAVVHAGAVGEELRTLAPGVRIVSVPLPANIPVEPADLPAAPPYRLLFYGFVRPYKGLDVALDALRLLHARRDDLRLTVAGEFWAGLDETRTHIARAGLGAVVDLRPGFVSEPDTAALLASHHLVVAPYRSATQSGIVPIAFQAGRPVVATDVGGLSEHVIDGVTGTLAPAGDPDAFAAAIDRAVTSLPELARGAAEHRASWADVAVAVLEASV